MECSQTNGPPTGYEIRVYDLSHIMKTVFVSDASTTHYTFNDLPPCKYRYSFSIAAVNEAGIGKHSNPTLAAPISKGMVAVLI